MFSILLVVSTVFDGARKSSRARDSRFRRLSRSRA